MVDIKEVYKITDYTADGNVTRTLEYTDGTTDDTDDMSIICGDKIFTDNNGVFVPVDPATVKELDRISKTTPQVGLPSPHVWPSVAPIIPGPLTPRRPTIFPEFPFPMPGKCSKCKKEGLMEESWNWGDNPDLTRYICKKCKCKVLDKMYDLDVDVDTEEVLFDKREEGPSEES